MTRRNKTKISSDINVVPFIDVMLVLLIIFMVTAPILQQSVEVDLPETSNNKTIETEKKNSIFLVSIKEDNSIYASFDGNSILVSEDKLLSMSRDFLNKNKDSKAFLRADKNIKYEKVISTMDLLKESGYDKVGLISKAN